MQHKWNVSFVKIDALEDEYEQNGPRSLYSHLTCFDKEAYSIVFKMLIS